MLTSVRQRTRFVQFTRREIAERHRGSFIGLACAFVMLQDGFSDVL